MSYVIEALRMELHKLRIEAPQNILLKRVLARGLERVGSTANSSLDFVLGVSSSGRHGSCAIRVEFSGKSSSTGARNPRRQPRVHTGSRDHSFSSGASIVRRDVTIREKRVDRAVVERARESVKAIRVFERP